LKGRGGERRWTCWLRYGSMRNTWTRTLTKSYLLYSIPLPLPLSLLCPLIATLLFPLSIHFVHVVTVISWMGAVRSFYCINQPYFPPPSPSFIHSFTHIPSVRPFYIYHTSYVAPLECLPCFHFYPALLVHHTFYLFPHFIYSSVVLYCIVL